MTWRNNEEANGPGTAIKDQKRRFLLLSSKPGSCTKPEPPIKASNIKEHFSYNTHKKTENVIYFKAQHCCIDNPQNLYCDKEVVIIPTCDTMWPRGSQCVTLTPGEDSLMDRGEPDIPTTNIKQRNVNTAIFCKVCVSEYASPALHSPFSLHYRVQSEA